ncbi:hypothetical protein [Amycolatopsis sp. YIM 10]|uniref:hypothetical protein n=1 Tax=Amycolatopsis sp. YIM 10 TaxID=2653857 RepID=UPI00128FFD00|nr:hypothetical protein [Amycolatopsis sp. YIM 10]QFU89066.1 hypothetical protein YIM_19435 [Amycolatopsis sp. YIM 10]
MTARVLRTELRRSSAPWTGLVFLALTLGLLFGLTGPWVHGSAPWTGQWNGLGLWLRELLIFTWPVVTGLGAWQGTRQRRSGMDELLATTPRPAWHQVAVLTGAVALTLVVATLVPFAVGAVQVAGGTGYFTAAWVPALLVGLLATVAGALLGMATGHLLPYVVTPPVCAVAALALLIFLMPSPDPGEEFPLRLTLLSPNLEGPDTAYTTVALSVHIGQLLWFGGLAVTGFTLLTVRPKLRALAALPALAGIALALVVLPGERAAAYPDDVAAAAPVCDHAGAEVCVTTAHSLLLSQFTGPARQVLAELAVLPNAPVSVTEVPDLRNDELGSLPRPSGVLQVDLNDGETRFAEDDGLDPARLRLSMLMGAGTLPCGDYAVPFEQADEHETSARLAVASWFADGPARPVTLPRQYLARYAEQAEFARGTLFSLPREEQVRRVAAARDAGLSCEGSMWAILTQGAR